MLKRPLIMCILDQFIIVFNLSNEELPYPVFIQGIRKVPERKGRVLKIGFQEFSLAILW